MTTCDDFLLDQTRKMSKVLHEEITAGVVTKLIQTRDPDEQINLVLKSVSGNDEEAHLVGEFVASVINHLHDNGANVSQIISTVSFVNRFVRNTCQTTLIDALRTLNQTISDLSCLNRHQMKSLLEYLNSTYFKHYNLYKYVLTRPRDQDYSHFDKAVSTLDDLEPLSLGVEESQWNYEQKVNRINEQHSVALNEAQNISRTKQIEKLHPGTVVHQDNIDELVVKYVRQHCDNIYMEVEMSLRLTELTMNKEIALIEANIEKLKEKRAKSPSTSISPKKSPPKSGRKSAGKTKK